MKKIKITNEKMLDLWAALNIVAQTPIPTRMRYAIARCRQTVEPLAAAFNIACPPEVESPENLARAAAIRKSGGSREEGVWLAEHDGLLADRKRILQMEAEVELCTIPLVEEISDCNFKVPSTEDPSVLVAPTAGQLAARNQRIVEALLPALEVDSED